MEIYKLEFIKYIKYNFLCKKIKRNNGAKILPMSHSCLFLGKGAHIELNGNFKLNANSKFRNSHKSTICRIDDDAQLFIGVHNKPFHLYYGCDVIVFSGGTLTLKSGFCNSDTKIRCKNSITIGEDVVVSHNVTIEDYDGHQLYHVLDNGEKKAVNISEPIVIGNHVWIGAKATILKGVTIGDGAVIAAGSLVTTDIPPGCLCAGVPAKVIREKVEWE